MYKVVIADDSALSVKGLEANLNFAAMNAELVGSFLSGMDVVAFLRDHPDVDLLVSDIRMPHMTGLELAREALAINPQIRIVLISAYDDFEYAQEALRIGVTDYVQKPIEYDVLENAMRKALRRLEEDREILRRLEAAEPEMRKRFYQDLTRAQPLLASHMLEKDAAWLRIPVSGGSFLCVAVTGDDWDSPADTQTLLLRSIALQDGIQKLFAESMSCQLVAERDMLLAVLHDPSAQPAFMMQHVRTLCDRFVGEKASVSCGLCIGIGDAGESLWDIPVSMEAAQRALNRRFIHPDQTVFTPQGAEDPLPFLTRLADSQTELVRLLLRRDKTALDAMIPAIASSAVANLRDPSVILPYLSVLASGIISQLRQDGVDLEPAARVLGNFSTRGRRVVDRGELESFLNAFFQQIEDALNQSQQNCQRRLVSQVKEYIADHLSDTQLHLESIAGAAHVTPSHLSRIFKRMEEIGVSDYITARRIDKAQRLLRGTSDPISLISDQVGYASPYYFSACFKKLTGQTPSEYRHGSSL